MPVDALNVHEFLRNVGRIFIIHTEQEAGHRQTVIPLFDCNERHTTIEAGDVAGFDQVFLHIQKHATGVRQPAEFEIALADFKARADPNRVHLQRLHIFGQSLLVLSAIEKIVTVFKVFLIGTVVYPDKAAAGAASIFAMLRVHHEFILVGEAVFFSVGIIHDGLVLHLSCGLVLNILHFSLSPINNLNVIDIAETK